MGTIYKAVNATVALQTPPTVFQYAEEGQVNALRQYIWDTFVLTADLASGDTILMGTLTPFNCNIVSADIGFGAMGGSCTVNVGWNASADAATATSATGLFNALPVSSAGVADLVSANGTATSYSTVAAFGQLLASPVQLVIAENAVSSGATGKAFWLQLGFFIS